MIKLVQLREINVLINQQESVDANLLSQASIVIDVLMDTGESEKINSAAKVSF